MLTQPQQGRDCSGSGWHTPIEYVLDLGPQLPELLSHATRKFAFIQDPNSVFVLRMRLGNLNSAAVWMLILSLGHFAILDILPKRSKCRAGLLYCTG